MASALWHFDEHRNMPYWQSSQGHFEKCRTALFLMTNPVDAAPSEPRIILVIAQLGQVPLALLTIRWLRTALQLRSRCHAAINLIGDHTGASGTLCERRARIDAIRCRRRGLHLGEARYGQ